MYKDRKLSLKDMIYIVLVINLIMGMISCSLIEYVYPTVNDIIGRLAILLRGIIVLLTLTHIIIQKEIKLRIILTMIIYAIIVILSYRSAHTWFLFDTLFIALFWGNELNYSRVITCFLNIYVIGTLVIFLLYCIGLLPDLGFIRGNGHERITLGFKHPNSLGFIAMSICMLQYLKPKNKRSKLIGLWFIFVSIFLLFVPNSITSGLLVFVLGVITLFEDKKIVKIIEKHVGKKQPILLYAFGGSVIVLVYLIMIRGLWSTQIAGISGTFYTRFIYGYRAILTYGFNLFGRVIELRGDSTILNGGLLSDYFTLDCVYVYVPIVYGIIPSIIFFIYYFYCIYMAWRSKNHRLLTLLIIGLFYGISETNIATSLSSFLYICSVISYKDAIKQLRGGNR